MKKLILLLAIAVGFASCEGDQGPPGFDGADGLLLLPLSFEETVDFRAPDYEAVLRYGDYVNINEVGLDDMTLVYILFDQTTDDQGNALDIWRLLPQTLYSDFGEYQYNFDATNLDVRIFLDGPASTDFGNFTSGDLDGQTFRVVILPVDFLSLNPGLDIANYEAVMNAANLQSDDTFEIQD